MKPRPRATARRKDPAGGICFTRFVSSFKAVADQDEDEEAPRRYRFVLSSPQPDREGDSVKVEGIKLVNYKRNPVVLFGHDYRGLPVGKATDVGLVDGHLEGEAEMVPRSMYPFAGVVSDMLEAGFLSAVSIGFMALKTAYDELRRGFDILEAELLEFSIVPVPMHQDALVVGRGAEHLAALKGWALEALQRADPGGLWLPQAEVREALKWKGRALATVPADPVDQPADPEPDPTPPADPPAPPADPPPADPTPTPPAPPAELVVLHVDPGPPTFHVTPEVVVAATRAAVTDLVAAQLRELTGRLPDA